MITRCSHEATVCTGPGHCQCDCEACTIKVVKRIVRTASKEVKKAEKKGKK